MVNSTSALRFKRISKQTAFRRFKAGQYFDICPCNMMPGFPWAVQCRVFPEEHIEHAKLYAPDSSCSSPTLWKGTLEQTAWDLMYNNWAFYNTNHEMGYYAHYYIEE